MRVSARADYALRAAAELAVASPGERLKRDALAARQDIPVEFLEHILLELKHAGIVQSQRGPRGGFRLARRPRRHPPGRRHPGGGRPDGQRSGFDDPERVSTTSSAKNLPRRLDRRPSRLRAPSRVRHAPGPHRRELAPLAMEAAHRGARRLDLSRSGGFATLGPRQRTPTPASPPTPSLSTRPQRRLIHRVQTRRTAQVDDDADHQHHDHRRQQPRGVGELTGELSRTPIDGAGR